MRTRFKSMLFIIAIFLFLSLALGGFYLTYGFEDNNDAFIKISGPLSINYLPSYQVKGKNDVSTKVIVINDSSEDAYYYIEFTDLKDIDGVTFNISDGKDKIISDKLQSFNSIISSYILIEAGEIKEYTFNFNSSSNKEFSLNININVENLELNTFADTILKQNEIKKESSTKIGEEIAINDEGLITGLDDHGTTYYFRGNVQNNYVAINDLLFRIVRINGDGSVKIVLNNDLEELSKYYEQDSFSYSSISLSSTLESWAKRNLGEANDIIASQKYCNDLSKSGDDFLAYKRINFDNVPSFYCLSESYSGKVALLNADEVIYAGGSVNEENTSFYLYNAQNTKSSYLMTSGYVDNGNYYPFVLSEDGKVKTENGTSALAVRPVITINKTAIVSDGNGSVNNPYILTKSK